MSVERSVKMLSPSMSGLPLHLTLHGPAHSGFATVQKTLTALYNRMRHLANPCCLDFLPVSERIEDHATMAINVVDKTRAMINDATVAAMKPGAYLINTARGPICDTAALLAGLKSGKLGAVGLDVLPKEPASTGDALVAAWQQNEPWIRGRVLLNPHAAFYSPDSLGDLRRKAIETAYFYLRDGTLGNCVNAEFLKQPR